MSVEAGTKLCISLCGQRTKPKLPTEQQPQT